ncbi:CHAT domain-containing protein [Marinoscillum pacificum]|uniref:CHAT domain-containing protein n=1 Tax=Marinoscillum pacificum TaxID=392723 RepID=UPI0021587D2A|nr:CHAT domain-containing tetratricopeptide repeat protein [Marinoscillum pacificum]
MFYRTLLTLSFIACFIHFSAAQFGDLRKKLQEKAAEVVKEKVIEKTDEKQNEFDTTSLNYAIAFLDKTESFQNRQDGERLVTATRFALRNDIEKTDREEARDLYELGRLSYGKRAYYIAELNLLGAKLAFESLGETTDPVYHKTLGTLGLLYSDMGRFDRAEELTKEALEGWESSNGSSSAGYAAEFNNMAVLSFSQGNLKQAERDLTTSLGQIKRVEGENSVPYAIALNNLGILYQYMGRFEEALDYLEQCIELADKELREKSSTYVQFLTNKALILQEIGDYSSAESTYKQAMDIQTSRMKLNKTSDPDYAHMLNNLASLYMVSGREEEAKKLLEESLKIYETKFGDNHLLTAGAKSDLGRVNLYQGDYAKASSLLVSSYSVFDRLLGSDHAKTISAKEDLATLAWKQNDIEKANTYYTEVLDASLNFINEFFPSLSEVEKTKYWQQFKPRFQNYYRFVADQATNKAELVGSMMNYRIKTKGLLLNASTKIRNTILSSGDDKLISLYEQWQDQKRMLSTYYSFSKEDLQEQKVNLDSLEDAANLSERKLSEMSTDFSGDFIDESVDYKKVASGLSSSEAIVEIVQIPAGALSETSAYVAIYLDQSTIELVKFDKGTEFDSKYYKLYSNLVKQKLDDAYSYDIFWSALAPKVSGKSVVYLSPDGVFNQINVNTLKSTAGKFVIQDYQVAYVGNPNDVLTKKKAKIGNQAFLMGFPTYGSSEIVPLPGTKKEVDMINSTLKPGGVITSLYTQKEASEKVVKSVNSPSVVHIATHGFFLEDKSTAGKVFGVQVDYANDNPLLRSGLLLAGSGDEAENQSFDGSDNGVLTAYEAINLPLTKTDLVVLSACETGKGEVKSGEGVYGLQRAFMIAGANSLIMSLWKVDDEATQRLMSTFYANMIQKKQDLDVAFRNAQLEIMKSYAHPNYWGAFVLLR